MSLAAARLQEERKAWRKDHPAGFWARPARGEDGKQNIFCWEAGIPGREGTLWEGGEYRLRLEFPEEYPSKPPKCVFHPVLFHPNVYPSGTVCLSIINEAEDWKPHITVKQVLLGIQELLDNPNLNSPAQAEPYRLMSTNLEEYQTRVRKQVETMPPGR